MESRLKLEKRTLELARYAALGVMAACPTSCLTSSPRTRIRDGTLTGLWASAHTLIDKLFPLIAGLALGVLIHYRRTRLQLAAHRDRAEALRSSLHKLERDQAVWVLAAAVLHELNNPLHALGVLLDEHAASDGDAAHQQALSARARRQIGAGSLQAAPASRNAGHRRP